MTYKIWFETKISPTLFKQYIYCPVIPWIIIHYNIQEPSTDSMKIAKENQRVRHGKGQIRIKTRKGYTIIDEIIENGKKHKILVEKKQYRSKSIHRYVVQTIYTYLIARQKIKNIKEIIIDNGGEKHKLLITEEIIQQVITLLNNLEKAIHSDKPPLPTTNYEKCKTCWYKRYCPYT